MNSMKTLATFAVLAAVAYGVYATLNRNAETGPSPPPPGGWPEGPPQEVPDLAAFTPNLGEATSAQPGAGGVPPVGAAVGASGVPSIEAASGGSPPGGQAGQPGAAPPHVGGQSWPEDPAAAPGGPVPAHPSGPGAYADPASGAPPIGAPADGQAGSYPSTGSPNGPSPYAPAGPPGGGYPDDRAAAPAVGETPPQDARAQFDELMQVVDQELQTGRLAEAHLALSRLYENPNLPVEMQERVVDLLDQLAGTVIYSREHHLEPPHVVAPNETLESIAGQYDVPAVLLARINGLKQGQPLEPEQELKVVRGPFRARVDLDRYELTLMLGRRYAGRFPIGVGEDQLHLEGSYTVKQKVVDPPYNGPDGTIAGGTPDNPLGRYYIDLGNYIGIHGTNNPRDLHRTAGRGAIRLGERDINDLYGILSVGSEVVIRR